jgi:signal transduction histidine kinase
MSWSRLIVVGLLFVASLAALVVSAATALWGETNELTVRDRVRSEAVQLALAAQEVIAALPEDGPGKVLPEAENRKLANLVTRILADDPGAEGGFYLAASDQFAGTVMTLPQEEPMAEKGKATKGADKKGDKKKAEKGEKKEAEKSLAANVRRDPPPRETEAIRQLARAALEAEPGAVPTVEVRDVGPSRVAIATVAVGDDRPARVAVWVMVRLTGPEQQKARLGRLQLATGFSLVGILLALGLTLGLIRSLRQETLKQERLRDELRKSEHLAALGRMLAGVAHEIRNPLTAIRSTVQLWERLPDRARTPESLAAVVAAVDRLDGLVGRLLLFARSGQEGRRAADLYGVVAETLELIRARAAAQKVEVESDLAGDLPPVAGAHQVISQVVLNLLTNALQAMPEGGALSCRTRRARSGLVELLVGDTGPGIPGELRDRIFEPFFTTRPDGTGLGLALCREVARQQGGDVTLEPEAGPGATVLLTLPPASGEPPP